METNTQNSVLNKRLVEMKDSFNDLPTLEKLYFNISEDIGLLNNSLVMFLPEVRVAKQQLKEVCKTISQFNRDFEMTATSDTLKSYKYQIEALKHLKSGIRVRIDSLKAEVGGQY